VAFAVPSQTVIMVVMSAIALVKTRALKCAVDAATRMIQTP